jgi:hypothetical protein
MESGAAHRTGSGMGFQRPKPQLRNCPGPPVHPSSFKFKLQVPCLFTLISPLLRRLPSRGHLGPWRLVFDQCTAPGHHDFWRSQAHDDFQFLRGKAPSGLRLEIPLIAMLHVLPQKFPQSSLNGLHTILWVASEFRHPIVLYMYMHRSKALTCPTQVPGSRHYNSKLHSGATPKKRTLNVTTWLKFQVSEHSMLPHRRETTRHRF